MRVVGVEEGLALGVYPVWRGIAVARKRRGFEERRIGFEGRWRGSGRGSTVQGSWSWTGW